MGTPKFLPSPWWRKVAWGPKAEAPPIHTWVMHAEAAVIQPIIVTNMSEDTVAAQPDGSPQKYLAPSASKSPNGDSGFSHEDWQRRGLERWLRDKSPCRSYTGPRLDSQNSGRGSQLQLTPVLRDCTLASDPCGHLHTRCTYKHWDTYTYAK